MNVSSETDTLTELESLLQKDHSLRLLYRHLKNMPDYVNKDIHMRIVERRGKTIIAQIEVLTSRLILWGR